MLTAYVLALFWPGNNNLYIISKLIPQPLFMKNTLLFLCSLLLAVTGRGQSIMGPSSFCQITYAAYSGIPSGGIWSTSAAAIVSVNPTSGLAYGVSPGTAVLTYTLPSSAFAVYPVTVLPGVLISTAGAQRVCMPGTISHSASVAGGTWSATPTSIATVSTSGVVTPSAAGLVSVTYTTSSGCTAVVTDTFVTAPSAIGGSLFTCVGNTTTLTNSTAGGTWASSNPAVATIGVSTGVVSGVAVGTANITYTVASGCFVTATVTVNSAPVMTISSPTLCVGATSTITGTVGGVWAVSPISIATPSSSGIAGVAPGTATVTYSIGSSGCFTTSVVTVMSTPASISGVGSFCIPATPTAMSTPSGGTWSSSSPGAIAVGPATGILSASAAGSAVITYALSTGCYTTAVATAMVAPVLTVTATPDACGNGYTLNATGGTSYAWSPAGGLSCGSCSSPTTSPTGPVTYTVLDYSTSGCGATATVTLPGNRIYGHISFSGMPPASPAMLVWLVQYNPSDSSITALDSVATCLDGGIPFYKFDGKPSGNYLVKARLNSSVPGTSDYIPTYGSSTPNWFSAATIAHASGTDVQNITMLYGTVPSGSGFISGYVYSGAGKGTSGEIPVEGMIVYLRNTAGDVLTYTYTDASGAYSFSGLAYGSYVIFPTEHAYYTTPSTAIVVDAATPSRYGITFKQYTTSGIIVPWSAPSSVLTTTLAEGTTVYPNPSTGIMNILTTAQFEGSLAISLTDVTGRVVFTSVADVDAKGQATADIHHLSSGLYMVHITSAAVNYTGKISVQH